MTRMPVDTVLVLSGVICRQKCSNLKISQKRAPPLARARAPCLNEACVGIILGTYRYGIPISAVDTDRRHRSLHEHARTGSSSHKIVGVRRAPGRCKRPVWPQQDVLHFQFCGGHNRHSDGPSCRSGKMYSTFNVVEATTDTRHRVGTFCCVGVMHKVTCTLVACGTRIRHISPENRERSHRA